MVALLLASGCSFSPSPVVLLADAGDPADAPLPEFPCAQGVITAGLAGASGHTCVPRDDGRVMCFGKNDRGQLGDGTDVDRLTPEPTVASGIVALAASPGHTCGHTNDGSLYCWGSNGDGQLGRDTSGSDQLDPLMVALGTAAGGPAAGERHTCVRVSGNGARCWGDGSEGQLGQGVASDSFDPIAPFGLAGVAKLAAGQAHTCALTTGGGIFCWGRGDRGQLGNGMTMQENQPVEVMGVVAAGALAVGWNHACAIAGGQVYCWGANDTGQLGTGDINTHATPQMVQFVPPITPTAIAAGEAHSCVLTSTAEIICWGSNLQGQLGTGGPAETQNAPNEPAGEAGWLDLAAGGAQTCARRTEDLTVWCWGDGSFGQLGYGGTEDRTLPARATGLCVEI